MDNKEVPSKWVLADSNGQNVHHIAVKLFCILYGPPNIQDDQIEEGSMNSPKNSKLQMLFSIKWLLSWFTQ